METVQLEVRDDGLTFESAAGTPVRAAMRWRDLPAFSRIADPSTHRQRSVRVVGDGPRSLRHATARSAVAWRGVLGRVGAGAGRRVRPLAGACEPSWRALSRPVVWAAGLSGTGDHKGRPYGLITNSKPCGLKKAPQTFRGSLRTIRDCHRLQDRCWQQSPWRQRRRKSPIAPQLRLHCLPRRCRRDARLLAHPVDDDRSVAGRRCCRPHWLALWLVPYRRGRKQVVLLQSERVSISIFRCFRDLGYRVIADGFLT